MNKRHVGIYALALALFTAPAGAEVIFDGTTFTGNGAYSENVAVSSPLTATPSGGNIDFTGAISGSSSFTKSGTGSISFSGALTDYSGSYVLSGGNLTINSPSAKFFNTRSLSINGGGTLTVTANQMRVNATGLVISFGAAGGTLATGSTNFHLVNGAQQTISTTENGTSSVFSGALNVNSSRLTINVAPSSQLDLSARVWNGGTVNKTGTGTLIVRNSKDFNGTITVSEGTLSYQPTEFNDLTIDEFAVNGGVLSMPNALNRIVLKTAFGTNAGTLNITGSNTHLKNSSAAADKSVISLAANATQAATVTGGINANGGSLEFNVGANSTLNASTTFSSDRTDVITVLSKTGAGTVNLTTNLESLVGKLASYGGDFNIANSTSSHWFKLRGVTVDGGNITITRTGSGQIHFDGSVETLFTFGSQGGTITVNGGNLHLARDNNIVSVADNVTNAVLAGEYNINQKTLTFDVGAGSVLDVTGRLWNNNGKIVKSGEGTVILSNPNNFADNTGATLTVSEGKLQVGNVNALANYSSVTVNSGAILDCENLAATIADLNLDSGLQVTVFDTGSGATVNPLSINNITFGDNATLILSSNGTPLSWESLLNTPLDLIVSDSAFGEDYLNASIDSSALLISDEMERLYFSLSTTELDGKYVLQATGTVPEPSSWLLALLSLVGGWGLFSVRRKRR